MTCAGTFVLFLCVFVCVEDIIKVGSSLNNRSPSVVRHRLEMSTGGLPFLHSLHLKLQGHPLI